MWLRQDVMGRVAPVPLPSSGNVFRRFQAPVDLEFDEKNLSVFLDNDALSALDNQVCGGGAVDKVQRFCRTTGKPRVLRKPFGNCCCFPGVVATPAVCTNACTAYMGQAWSGFAVFSAARRHGDENQPFGYCTCSVVNTSPVNCVSQG